ncbi:putative cathepsin H [Dioscorea sansibarensis]
MITGNGGINSDPSYPYTGTVGTCRFDPNHIAAKVIDIHWVRYGAEEDLEKVVGLIGPVSVANLNHAMLFVGYGVTYYGEPYWILKNSWGDGWGDARYLHMKKKKYVW